METEQWIKKRLRPFHRQSERLLGQNSTAELYQDSLTIGLPSFSLISIISRRSTMFFLQSGDHVMKIWQDDPNVFSGKSGWRKGETNL